MCLCQNRGTPPPKRRSSFHVLSLQSNCAGHGPDAKHGWFLQISSSACSFGCEGPWLDPKDGSSKMDFGFPVGFPSRTVQGYPPKKTSRPFGVIFLVGIRVSAREAANAIEPPPFATRLKGRLACRPDTHPWLPFTHQTSQLPNVSFIDIH